MIDFDKMTVAEHEAYKEMQRKAELVDAIEEYIKAHEPGWKDEESYGRLVLMTVKDILNYERRD